MGIYRPPTVAEQPYVELSQWRIYEIEGKNSHDRHLVGYLVGHGDGRATSKIMHFDAGTMLITTRSGRVYHLNGPSAYNADADYVWKIWRAHNGIAEEGRLVSIDYEEHTKSDT